MALLSVSLLGGFRVHIDGGPALGFSTDKARGMRTTMQEAGRHTDMAHRHYGLGREAGRAAANQRRVAMGQARRGKWALAGGAAALVGGTGLAVYGNRRKGKVRKAIEPDVDPGGFLEQVQREHEVLRDSGGRFAGKVVDDVGPAIVATPYTEEE